MGPHKGQNGRKSLLVAGFVPLETRQEPLQAIYQTVSEEDQFSETEFPLVSDSRKLGFRHAGFSETKYPILAILGTAWSAQLISS